MINNVASVIFGFIYIALWQAVAPAPGPGLYTRSLLTAMMVLAQTFIWVSMFVPGGLGIPLLVRTGSIATEMTRPVPFFALILSREAGSIAYQALFRAVPVALLLALAVGFPRPASSAALALTLPSLVLAAYVNLTLAFTIGIASLWTVEVRWAHWLYSSLIALLSGGWVPADLLPGRLGRVAPYLPFAVLLHYPVRIYLGLIGAEGLAVQGAWALALTLWCRWLTARALHRVVVQGG